MEEIFRPARERDEQGEPDERSGDHAQEQLRRDRAPFSPAVQHDQAAERDEDEEGVFFRHHHRREADGEAREPARVVRGAEVFPQQPEAHERPEGEEAVDHPVLREMDLHGRESHQRERAEHRAVAAQTPGEKRGRDEREDGEKTGDGFERGERGGIRGGAGLVQSAGAEKLAPDAAAEDVEETRGRQFADAALGLLLEEIVAKRGIRAQPFGVQQHDVALVEMLVEPHAGEARRRMDADERADGEQHKRQQPDAGGGPWGRPGTRRARRFRRGRQGRESECRRVGNGQGRLRHEMKLKSKRRA